MTQSSLFNGKSYDQVWTDRFLFFQQNGEPSSKNFKEALKPLASLQKMRVNVNFYALLFGFIYFLVKGMWKGAITLFGLSIILFSIAAFLPDFVGSVFGFFTTFLGAFTANYTFYRKEVLGENDFNIFKGMRF